MGEIGVSPKVHYSNPERGIVAMQSIDTRLATGRDPEILNQIPDSSKSLMKLIRKVHQSKNLNGHLTNRIAIDYARKSYQDLSKEVLDEDDTALLERIVNTTWPDGELTLTHNDFRSSNLLYDGERFLLIDWELGGLGHPFYDVAYFANYQALSKRARR